MISCMSRRKSLPSAFIRRAATRRESREVYRLLFGRAPNKQEIDVGLAFLRTTPEKPGNTVNGEPLTAWKQYARVLLSANEFEFVD